MNTWISLRTFIFWKIKIFLEIFLNDFCAIISSIRTYYGADYLLFGKGLGGKLFWGAKMGFSPKFSYSKLLLKISAAFAMMGSVWEAERKQHSKGDGARKRPLLREEWNTFENKSVEIERAVS